jgi:hypothetical protein
VGLVGTAKHLHRLVCRLPTLGMQDEWGSPIEKRLQRRYVAVEVESEMDVEGE